VASPLDTMIARAVAQGFTGRLLPGVLLREVPVSVNDSGDPIGGSLLTFTCQGIRDHFSAAFAAAAGIPTTDVRILLISGLIQPTTTARIDDMIRMRDDGGTQQWHKVRAVLTVDPANAHVVLQCFEIATPEGAPD
jgi:hypothetical protein